MASRALPPLVLAFALALPRALAACPPAEPGLTSTLPTDLSTYPANGVLIFWGHDISLANVTATVDGQPATLAPASGLPFGGLTAFVQPMPAAGQQVVVQGDFCNPGNTCAIETLTFTAGPPDLTPPASPSSLIFDVYDYPDFEAQAGSCQISSELAFWIDVAAAPATEGEAPVMLLVDASPNPGPGAPVSTRRTFIDAPVTTLEFRSYVQELGGKPPPEAFCFEARVMDTAGNTASGPVAICDPCHYRSDPPGMSATEPQEPAWTDADIYPGGVCDLGAGGSMGSGGSGGGGGGGGAGAGTGAGGGAGAPNPTDPESESGCGCRVIGDRPSRSGFPLAALGTMLALGIVVARFTSRGRG